MSNPLEEEVTYEQKEGPPPTDFDNYAQNAKIRWENIIDGDTKEKKVQKFLEKNPSFVPGAWTPGTTSGHAPHNLALISQPRLTGLNGKQPDFMWISRHSLAWYPTLIEIERPSKKIYRKDGTQPRAEFHQAANQLREWKTWFSSPENISQFVKDYGVSYLERSESLQMRPYFVLIYGRREEFENNPSRKKHRASLLGDDMELMSFDRLGPDSKLRDAITVRAKGDGQYEVKSVAPTFALSPARAEILLDVENFENAFESDSRISTEREEFLLERIEYWREWASSEDSKGMFSFGFRE